MHLTADLSKRTLEVSIAGEPVKTYAVGIGLKAHPTPTGDFRLST